MNSKQIRKNNLRLLLARLAKKLAQGEGVNAAFAKLVGTDPSYISQILSSKARRNVGDEFARQIERTQYLEQGWMDLPHFGEWRAEGIDQEGEWNRESVVAEGRLLTPAQVQATIRQLPLISWTDALRWPADDIERQPGPPVWQPPGQAAPHYSDKAFALVVDSDAYGPDIPKGSTLYVEPESRQGRNGWVLVALPGHKTPTIWTAVPGLDPNRPALRNPTASQAPAQLMPEGAIVLGAVVFVLPA